MAAHARGQERVDLLIVPNPHIQTPEYSIKRVRTDEIDLPENKVLSYKMPERPQVADPTGTRDVKPVLEPAAVIPTAPATSAPVIVHVPVPAKETPAPAPQHPANLGFWSRLVYLFTGSAPATKAADPAPARSEPRRDGQSRRPSSSGRTSRQGWPAASWRRP
jgi:ribonuclease E